MRSSNRSRAWWGIAALGAAAAVACGGSSGLIQATIDASTSDGSSAGNADASAAHDATSTDGASARLDAPADATAAPLDASLDVTPSDASADGPEICNAVTNAAPAVLSTVADAASPPAQTGMAIASGTYFLTQATSYGATLPLCAGASVKGTVVVGASSTTAGTLDGVIEYSFGTTPLTTQTVHADYTTSGSTLSLVATCPSNDAGATTSQYSASATSITVVQPAPAPVQNCGMVLEVFTKQ